MSSRFNKWFGRGGSQVERDLIASRPEPSARLVKSISARVQPRREARSRGRLGYVAAFSVAMLAVLGGTGGLGYAASSVQRAAASVSHIAHIGTAPSHPGTSAPGVHTSACSQYIQGPTVSGADPDSGHVGDTITVSGTNFTNSRTHNGVITVSFATNKSATPTGVTATSFTVVVPNGAVTGAITVTNCNGFDTTPFTVLPPVPVLNSINPTAGLRGKTITLSGANYVNGADRVRFGTTFSGEVTWVSPTTLTAKVPTSLTPNTRYNVRVIDTQGQTSATKTYFVTPAPVIADINPASGLRGSSVTVTGSNFTPDAETVLFGAAKITPSDVTSGSLTFTVPTNAALTATTVKVSDANGTTDGRVFTFTPAPTLTGMSAIASTGAARGQTITLTGANYVTGKMTVLLDGTRSVPATTLSATKLTFRVPMDATLGHAYVVTVHDIDGTSSTSRSLKVAVAPTLTSLSKTSGKKGSSLTLNGANYVPGQMKVEFFSGSTLKATVSAATGSTTTTTRTITVPSTTALVVGSTYTVKILDGSGTSAGRSFKITA